MNNYFCERNHEIEVFERCYYNQLPLMLKGPTGCGKSQLVQVMAERLKLHLIKVACNEDTSSADLLGRFLIKGAETIWQDGPVTRAVRSGALLYLDEVAEAREDVVVALHPLTDHRRELYLDRLNETIQAPASFMCVASFNPGYQQGFKELKPSTRQRFVSLVMDYLNDEDESNLILRLTEVSSNEARMLAKLAQKIRLLAEYNLKETVSTRLLVNTAKLIHDGMEPRRAGYVGIAEVLSDDPEIIRALKDLIDLSF
ncbi:CbbQ/NirQ/NorQ/GpvN family protein [Candidatus Dojkabacteria bacterium]|uniref:CbbQ/NirQ/NorQ/GpvN family protein n=1 Tax=Candidatus Dojkabacteria bacterium TaxID=2099670 RepID=A0A955RGK7_9BACT|nr:CbbQ/NirQ/NorQ/GpvN family protein [Candidatus Dojkabacteria bacterium]